MTQFEITMKIADRVGGYLDDHEYYYSGAYTPAELEEKLMEELPKFDAWEWYTGPTQPTVDSDTFQAALPEAVHMIIYAMSCMYPEFFREC